MNKILTWTGPITAYNSGPSIETERFHRSSNALVINLFASGAIGAIFWIVAARLFSTAEVGRDGVIVNAAVIASSLAFLNFPVAVVTLIPRSRNPGHVIAVAYGTGVALAAGLATLFVIVGGSTIDGLSALRDEPMLGAAFVAMAALWGVYALQDSVLTGIGRAELVPIENVLYGVAKLLALVVLWSIGVDHGIVLGTLAPLPFVIVGVSMIVVRHIRAHPIDPLIAETIRWRNHHQFLAGNVVSSLASQALTGALPLVVLWRRGDHESGVFFLANMFATPIGLIAWSVALSFVAEASRTPQARRELARSALVRSVLITTAAVGVMLILAPVILRFAGEEYATESAAPLRLMVLGSLAIPPVAVYTSLGLTRRSARRSMVISVISAVATFAIAVPWIDAQGANGAALTQLVVWSVLAIAVMPRLWMELGLPEIRFRLPEVATRSLRLSIHQDEPLSLPAVGVTAAVVLLPVLTALHAPSPIRLVAALAAVLLFPGFLVFPIERWHDRNWGFAIGTSLAVWVLGSQLCLSLGVWSPISMSIVAAVLAIARVVASTVKAHDQDPIATLPHAGLVRGQPLPPPRTQPSYLPLPGGSQLVMAVAQHTPPEPLGYDIALRFNHGEPTERFARLRQPGRSQPRSQPRMPEILRVGVSRPSWTMAVHGTLITGIVAAWIITIRTTEFSPLAEYGFASQFGPSWWLACVGLVVGFQAALWAENPSRALLATYLAVTVLVLHGTYAALTDVPYYPWVYKYIGVSRSIDVNGGVRPWADVYNNWPGTLALGGALSRLSHVDVMRLAQWCPPLFTLLEALAAGTLIRAFSRDPRVVYGGMWLFVASLWVGQNTWSPQPITFAFVLLAVTAAVLYLPNAKTSDRLRMEPHVVAGFALIVLFAAAISVSHQLSPFMAVAMLGLLIVFRTLRPWWLPAVFGLIAIGWFYVARGYIEDHPHVLEIGGNLFSNANKKSIDTGFERPASRHVGYASTALSLLIWGLGGIGAIAVLRRKPRDLRPVLLAAAPFGVLAGGSYGGEAIYRAFLFSLPAMCLLGATALFGGKRHWLKAVAATTAALLMIPLFTVAMFGRASLYVSTREDLALNQWFVDHSEPGATLASVAPYFPNRFEPNYADFGRPWAEIALINEPSLVYKPVTPQLIDAFADNLAGYEDTGDVYLATTAAQWRVVRNYGFLPGADAEELFMGFLATSERFQLVFSNGAGKVFKLR